MSSRIGSIRALSWLLCIAHEQDEGFHHDNAYGIHAIFELIADDMDAALNLENTSEFETDDPVVAKRESVEGIKLGDLKQYGSREAWRKAIIQARNEKKKELADFADKADEFLCLVDTADIAKRANIKKEAVERVMGLLREANRQPLSDPETDTAKAASA